MTPYNKLHLATAACFSSVFVGFGAGYLSYHMEMFMAAGVLAALLILLFVVERICCPECGSRLVSSANRRHIFGPLAGGICSKYCTQCGADLDKREEKPLMNVLQTFCIVAVLAVPMIESVGSLAGVYFSSAFDVSRQEMSVRTSTAAKDWLLIPERPVSFDSRNNAKDLRFEMCHASGDCVSVRAKRTRPSESWALDIQAATPREKAQAASWRQHQEGKSNGIVSSP